MARIGIYSGLYDGKGIGHIVRSASLSNYLIDSNNHEVFFWSNDVPRTRKILNDINVKALITEPESNKLDLLLLDSPEQESEMITGISYKKLGRLDYFIYSNNEVDFIINLYNHEFDERKELYKGILFEGLEYTILKEEILKAKKSIAKPHRVLEKVLITFSGNDPKNNTLKAIHALSELGKEITVICPPQRQKEEYEQLNVSVNVIDVVQDFGQRLSDSDLIFCGGGTSLLEAIYFGKPIVAIGQNEMEDRFIAMIKERINLYRITDVPHIVSNYQTIQIETAKKYDKVLDGKGKERIKQIIEEQIR